MKKVVSLILVVALFATLAVAASADVVTHAHNEDPSWLGEFPWIAVDCDTLTSIYHDATQPWEQALAVDWATALVRWSAQQVKVLDITDGVKQTWTTEAQAITADELTTICENNEYGIENLTVFRQRNVSGAEGEIELSVKLWPCAPDKQEAHATVVLFRAEGAEEWTVVGYAADKVCDATLAGNGAYVVALAW